MIKNLVSVFIFAVVALIVGGFTGTAHALTVSPARIEITGDPGQTITGEIELFNEQQDARTFFSSFENFEPAGDSGAPRFIGADDGLATWLATEANVTLGSGERKTIPFSITIPQNASPGGYFAAIFWGSQAPGSQGSGEVAIGGKIGILVLLRVSGDVTERGGLSDFTTNGNRKFFTMLPVVFVYRLNNAGGDRIVPQGELQIKNIIGATHNLPVNKSEGSVLPNSTRKFEVSWLEASSESAEQRGQGFFETAKTQWNDFHFGWYTATLHVTWGSTNQTANAVYTFFIVPWQLLVVVFVLLLVIGALGLLGLRRYNRYIIRRYGRQQMK